MRGAYSEELQSLRDKLLNITSLLELELDFSEEDVEFADRRELRAMLDETDEVIVRLMESFRVGNAIREGVNVAIVGAPNVGKSTLLNRLVGDDRAMVSNIAGTTRDVIEERLTIEGLPFRILDTAGLRSTEDRLEQMGIERTRQTIERAQIVIWMVEATQLPATAPFTLRADQQLICVANKIDCAPDATLPADWIALSARTGEGIDRLCRAMCAVVPTEQEEQTIVSNARHYEALNTASDALDGALRGIEEGLPTDLLSEEIRAVIHALGTITARGVILPSEVLAHIFGHFCIGK